MLYFVPFFFLLLFLLGFYISPFFLYMDLGLNLTAFFLLFFPLVLLKYFPYFRVVNYFLYGALRSLHSLFKHILIYFIKLKLYSFCIFYIIAISIYKCKRG